ncbi:MAG TPA: pentapeptide repeat-containing protein [Leptospiraceae bacterium]|nr:pentapeptide repeat-containing protein [Leptospiraceae bacterium]
MKLTIEQIANHSPCGDGAKWFREFYPNGLDLVSWTRDEQLRAITSGGHRYLGWAVAKGLVPMWAMVGAYLVGASLVGANLVGANLDGANLVEANLDGARIPAKYKEQFSEQGYNLEGVIWIKD